MNYCLYNSPVGPLMAGFSEKGIRRIDFGGRLTKDMACRITPVAKVLSEELDEYFAGVLTEFTVQPDLHGTEFQMDVWGALMKIPYGETMTYSQIAAAIGRPGASRAVGAACRSNPVPIIIPCHRVVGKDGSLTGYAGGLGNKEFLLNLEKQK